MLQCHESQDSKRVAHMTFTPATPCETYCGRGVYVIILNECAIPKQDACTSLHSSLVGQDSAGRNLTFLRARGPRLPSRPESVTVWATRTTVTVGVRVTRLGPGARRQPGPRPAAKARTDIGSDSHVSRATEAI